MNYREHITVDPLIRSGKPCIRGTRIAVADVFDYLGGGMTSPEVLDDFPDLTADDIQACFAFADVPLTFRQGMAEIAAGLHVDMDTAMNEPPPANHL